MERRSVTLPEIVVIDVCNKTNKRVCYTTKGEDLIIALSDINSWNFLQHLNSIVKDIFLPKGYPESVSSDYLEYQMWDTCQAFCSSISSTLAMRAVMQGIGVGSEAATPVSAAVTWLLKDGTGIIGGILFAWLKGSKFDSDCKKWRLFADILNDLAMLLELYIPYVMEYSMHILCISTVLKALVGTAGSSTRAALITHQAIKGNIADVSAKDGSQETFTNLCAFIFGIFLLKNVTETGQIWNIMYTATVFHLIFNYKAVRCLKINIFNSQRFRLAMKTYLVTSALPTVEQINKREPVFLLMGIPDTQLCGFSILFGASLKNACKAPEVTSNVFSAIMTLFDDKKYCIIPSTKNKVLYVSFQHNFTEDVAVKAYFHAYLLGLALNYVQGKRDLRIFKRCRKHSPLSRLRNFLNEPFVIELEKPENETSCNIIQAYIICDELIEKEFLAFHNACEEEGWSLNKHLFNIGDWRTEWKNEGKKHLNFKMGQTAVRFYTFGFLIFSFLVVIVSTALMLQRQRTQRSQSKSQSRRQSNAGPHYLLIS